MVLDSIASKLNLTWSQNKSWKSDITEATVRVEAKHEIKEYQVTLLKPRKLMNISGSCVAQAGKIDSMASRLRVSWLTHLVFAVKDLGISLQNLYVFHDDMQRDLGKVNLKGNGSANGHNGIKSVIENLKTNEFKRVRIGIGRPPADIDDRSYDVVAGFVLSKFTQSEMSKLEDVVYPMWTKNQGLELLCDKGQLFKPPKVKNKKKAVDPSQWEKNQQKKQVVDQAPPASPSLDTAVAAASDAGSNEIKQAA